MPLWTRDPALKSLGACWGEKTKREGKSKRPNRFKAIFLSKPFLKVYSVHILPQPHGNVRHWRCIWPRHHLYEFGWCTSTDSIPGRTCKVLTLAGGFWRFFHGMVGENVKFLSRMDARATRLLELQEAAVFFNFKTFVAGIRTWIHVVMWVMWTFSLYVLHPPF